MLKKSIGISLLLISGLSYGAVKGLSIHSRNNCGNNESISWDGQAYHQLQTFSQHYGAKGQQCVLQAPIEKTWRSAAVHWGEGTGGWVRVKGTHYLYDGHGKTVWMRLTDVKDCSIYDGWWEANAPT